MSAAPPRGAAASERRQLCAALASASEEPLIGKAGGTRAWVLLEHPGPWPHDAPRGPLPPHLVDAIERHADAHALRVLLIRRRGRPTLDGRLQSYLAWSGCDPPWMEERTLGDYAEILEADLAALAAGRRPGFGAPVAAPLFLVCTHGKKDPCCAKFGLPVARALAAAYGASVWESTHVGGDRFAGNLVCLPHGLYFGHLSPAAAVAIARGYSRGLVEQPSRYRGRSGQPKAVQAAEWYARAREGVREIEAIRVEEHRPVADGEEVVLRVAGKRRRVRVREVSLPPRPHGCAIAAAWSPPHWELVSYDASHG